MNITLIRHPRTTANAKGLIYGKTDYPYADVGKLQYQCVINYMAEHYVDKYNEKELKIRTSSRGRAKRLADGLGEVLGIKPVIDERVAEMDFGIFEGHTMEEVQQLYPEEYNNFVNHFDETTPPKGESYESFSQRIDHLLSDIKEHIQYPIDDLPTKELIIVSHGGVIRELIERILELEPAGSWKYMIGNGCIVQFVLTSEGYRLKQLIANGQ